MEIKLKNKSKSKIKMWIRRLDFVKKLGNLRKKREQDDLHKSTCHPRKTGKTRVLGNRLDQKCQKNYSVHHTGRISGKLHGSW